MKIHDDGMLRLDIACGKNKKPGYVGVDIWDGADVVVDLEKFPWPFEDNSVDAIFCSHYIEHTPDLISFANELYRILKVGAKAEIIAPYYSSIRAWQDPTHLRAISENTFLYFNNSWRVANRLDHYPIRSDFDFETSYIIDPAWQGKNDDELRFAIKHYINVVLDIRAVLTKRPSGEGATAEYLSFKASECWNEGNFESAVGFCEQLKERGEAGPYEYLMMADFAYRQNEFNKAVDGYRQALKDDDISFQAHVGLLRSLLMTGNVAKAREHVAYLGGIDSELADMIMDILHTESQQAESLPLFTQSYKALVTSSIVSRQAETPPGTDAKASIIKPGADIVHKLKDEYRKSCSAVSDIQLHLPVLYKYAKKCKHVTEMGSRTGVSTRAFLYANPGKFVSYDYQYVTPEPHLANGIQILITLFEECKKSGIDCEYVGQNVLNVEIEETDMLFIDTYHCYEQLKMELALHAGKVRKFIAFHDTTLFGEQGEGFPFMDPNHPVRTRPMDGSGGIRRAIDEFLASHPEWSIDYESTDSNGMIIIRRHRRRRTGHVAVA